IPVLPALGLDAHPGGGGRRFPGVGRLPLRRGEFELYFRLEITRHFSLRPRRGPAFALPPRRLFWPPAPPFSPPVCAVEGDVVPPPGVGHLAEQPLHPLLLSLLRHRSGDGDERG